MIATLEHEIIDWKLKVKIEGLVEFDGQGDGGRRLDLGHPWGEGSRTPG